MWEILIVLFMVALGTLLFYFWLENITKNQNLSQEIYSSYNI
jgi:hypothetical protein